MIRPKPDSLLGWAYRPDAETTAALSRGTAKLREHPELGSDRPHEGGDMAKALADERKALEKVARKGRRKKMAKKLTSKKKTAQAAPSKKKTKVAAVPEKKGKLIPLKTICAELDLDPKATRVKLRRLIANGDIDFHDLSQRWEFTPSQAKEVRSHLS